MWGTNHQREQQRQPKPPPYEPNRHENDHEGERPGSDSDDSDSSDLRLTINAPICVQGNQNILCIPAANSTELASHVAQTVNQPRGDHNPHQGGNGTHRRRRSAVTINAGVAVYGNSNTLGVPARHGTQLRTAPGAVGNAATAQHGQQQPQAWFIYQQPGLAQQQQGRGAQQGAPVQQQPQPGFYQAPGMAQQQQDRAHEQGGQGGAH